MELQQKIETVINQLPEQCGRIFRMSRNEQLKYREIADQLHISEKTVENQMGKALRNLKLLLQNYLPALLILIQFFHAY
jgi:RNA polymerase sigma-70 factor, ECF subfamily